MIPNPPMFMFGVLISSEQSMTDEIAERPVRQKRTPGLIILVLGLLLMAYLGGLRFEQAVANWGLLSRIQAQVGPLYLATSGMIWVFVCLVPVVGLWFRWPWAPRFTRIGVIVLISTYWAERLLLYRSPASQSNTIFALSLTALSLIFTFWVLSRPAQKRFFSG
jgi:hypothetical protein